MKKMRLSPAPAALCLLLLSAACSSTPSAEERARRVEIHRDSAASYIVMGEFERAEDQATKGLALDKDNVSLKIQLARAMQKQDRVDKIHQAELVYRNLTGEENFRVWLGLGETLERKGVFHREAATAVRDGRRHTNAEDVMARADELEAIATECWEESIDCYEQGLEFSPTNTELMNGLARTTALLGRREESISWCEATVQLVEGDARFWQEQLERPQITVREEERFRGSLDRLNRLEVGVRTLAATLHTELDDYDAAAAHYLRVIELEPKMAEAYSRRAALLVELGRHEEALADIDRFLRLTELDFDHADVQRAYRIKTNVERQLAQ